MSFSLTNLFNSIGDENLTLHNLDEVITTFQNRRGGSEVSFVTDQDLKKGAALRSDGIKLEKAAFIVFFDRAHLDLVKTPVPPDAQLWKKEVNELRNLYLALKGVREVGAASFFNEDRDQLDNLYHKMHQVFG